MEYTMSVRFSVVLSEDLNRNIYKTAEETETNKSEILRKVLRLFLAAREGKQRGLMLGLSSSRPRSYKPNSLAMSRRPRCEQRIRQVSAVLLWSWCVALALIGAAQAQPPTQAGDPNLAAVRKILQTPEADIDLARAMLTIDHMIDPGIDVTATLSQLDSMAQGIKAILPAGASSRLTMDALRYHMYQPSPWNSNRPFQYDLDDPFGANVRNKLLPTYLTTRKGNCVTMPLLFIILGQKLGVDVTASTAPNHVFVKYRDADGNIYNLETTSGAGFTRDVWIRQQFPMTDEALASGIYMRPLTRKETIGIMVGTLLESYAQRGLNQQRIAMAKLALEFNPKDVSAIFHQHQAHLAMWKQEFVNQYPTPNDIPKDKRPRFMELEDHLKTLYNQAHALGWRPLDQASEDKYRQTITRARSMQ
jgi:regulator of sirC expression with transglutaminase-like and TPR domain